MLFRVYSQLISFPKRGQFPPSFNRNVLEKVKDRAEVKTLITIEQQNAFIKLISKSGHLVGMTHIGLGKSFYWIYVIKVSESNLKQGFGRLLQMEAAALAIEQNIRWKAPSFFFTPKGKEAFQFYPLSPYAILDRKTSISELQTGKASDLPWKDH